MQRSAPVRIMIVDDEPLIRLYVRDILEGAGFEAEEAGSAEEALQRIREVGAFSTVITDIDMPGEMDGLGLAHSVRAEHPDMAILIMSGRRLPRPEQIPEAALLMTKPFSEDRLLNVLRMFDRPGSPANG